MVKMPENAEVMGEKTVPTNETVVEKSKEVESGATIEEPSYDINKFRLTRILQNNTQRKSIALLGTFPYLSDTDEAIILFEKQPFRESDVQTNENCSTEDGGGDQLVSKPKSYFKIGLSVKTEFINNIYGSFQCMPMSELGGLKATVVYPATSKHIEKYSICQKYVIAETPVLYESITLPSISNQFSLDWVYNILEHKQETERIVFEDPDPENGFILLPDLKWDGRNPDTLYLLALPHRRNCKSLRDLTADHLPLLRNIRTKAAQAIEERYGLQSNQLRFYFHYQPSFYHLHVHINPIRLDAPGIWCEKSHILDTVISNLELLPDYYRRVTLPFVVHEGSKLLELYRADAEPHKRRKCED